MRLFFAMAFPNGLVDLIDILHQCGVDEAVICPGSRNAPIMLALARHPGIRCYSISDERSAGFFGLGLALKAKKPVILCCTSGSAGLNFAPAVVEAFFQEVPLLILTADRPAAWIGQWDGQTIYQNHLFGQHVKSFATFPTDTEADVFVAQALYNIATSEPKGPIHLNIPIAEPFYPSQGEELPLLQGIRITKKAPELAFLSDSDVSFIQNTLAETGNILISVGQMDQDPFVQEGLRQLHRMGIPIIGDATANLPAEIICHHDLLLANEDLWPQLAPDLHIHVGKSFVTKRIKLFLRNYKPKHSWLIHPNPIGEPDPFQSLTRVFHVDAAEMLAQVIADKPHIDLAYADRWKNAQKTVQTQQIEFFSLPNWSEIHIYNQVIEAINKVHAEVHVANSLAIRYVNWTQERIQTNEVFSNRGTSGIDGCLSTAIGASQSAKHLVFSIIGDVAFQYDRNALWNNYLGDHLRIIVLNNHGGGIFRHIDGAKDLPELAEFMETKQAFTAKNTASDANINYLAVHNASDLTNAMKCMLDENEPALLIEIFTNAHENAETLQNYMALFKR